MPKGFLKYFIFCIFFIMFNFIQEIFIYFKWRYFVKAMLDQVLVQILVQVLDFFYWKYIAFETIKYFFS